MSSPGELLWAKLAPALGLVPEDTQSESLECRLDEPMSKHTTLRLGGPADLWLRPRSELMLRKIVRACHALRMPLRCVGSGTNLLVKDGGLEGVVVNLGRLNQIEVLDEARGHYRVQCGTSTGRLLKFALERSRAGVEFLAGVPGSVGGGLIMNAGTYLGEFTDVVKEVLSLRRDGAWVLRNHAQCGFRYRASDLPPEEIAVRCAICLPLGERAQMDEAIAKLRAHRKEREPSKVGNNGSTFKNPPQDYAGRLIEAAGLKGLRVNAAQVSPKHANWLVIDPEDDTPARSQDLLTLIDLVRDKVHAHSGVWLEREVKVIGRDA